MSKVLIYSTTGKSGFEIETHALTWDELQNDLSQQGVTHTGMKAVIGETRHTLESPKAEIPQGNFSLFLMPKKTKSGLTSDEVDALAYKDCRKTIKGLIDNAENPDTVKAFFSEGSRNYTQTKTDEMKFNLKEWFKGFIKDKSSTKKEELNPIEQKPKETIESEVVEEEKEINVADVVESVKATRPEDVVDFLTEIISALIDLNNPPYVEHLSGDAEESISSLVEELTATKDEIIEVRRIEEEERQRLLEIEKAKEEERKKVLAEQEAERKKEEERKRKLDEEAKVLSREFSDLRNL